MLNIETTFKGESAFTDPINPIQAAILKELIVDGRKSTAEMAKENNLPKETVQENYNILEQTGVIKGATIHINYGSFGFKAVAHLLITVEAKQSEDLIAYVKKMPEVYSAYERSPKGNIDITITIKTLRELEKIKDLIRKNFPVSEIRTAIWTDVKEMNHNLSVLPQKSQPLEKPISAKISNHEKPNPSKKHTVDEIDTRIADILSKDGRTSMEEIAKKARISVEVAKKRYEKLKKKGILKVTIQFDPTKIGYQALGIFFAVTSNVNVSSIINKISQIPDVISIMKTSGNYDLQIYTLIRDISQLLQIQEELGKIEGIKKMDTEILRMLTLWPSPRQYISTF